MGSTSMAGRARRPALEALCELEAFLSCSAEGRLGLDELERESERRGRQVAC